MLATQQSSDGSTGWRANLVLRVKRNMTCGYANEWKQRTGASQKLANGANCRRPRKDAHSLNTINGDWRF
jgi:hypothetical protein